MILALDTSSAGGSAALVRADGSMIERAGDSSRTHGERLPRELMSLLAEAGAQLAEVDAFAVCTGPGSFTGLRVGIATMQGLALARNRLVTPVSAFEAIAVQEFPLKAEATGVLGVWLDAQRREVFSALYGANGDELVAPAALSPRATLDAWDAVLQNVASVKFAGDGAVKYAGVIRERLGSRAILAEGAPLLAGTIARIAAAEPGRRVRPHAVVPLYVRRSDAELARDRRNAARA